MSLIRLFAALGLGAGCLLMPTHANAAESYDSCNNYIDAIPATISTQGNWCLRKNLATAVSSGAVINVTTNNVTLDCNGFTLGGLAAGNNSLAVAIRASGRQNLTVRNCGIRGFNSGMYIDGGSGHLIENNRLDQILESAIGLSDTSNTVVNNNRIFDVGGARANGWRVGIRSVGGDAVEITDNMISGVFETRGYTNPAYGIERVSVDTSGGAIHGYVARNRVSGLAGSENYGFAASSAQGTKAVVILENNTFVSGKSFPHGTGIKCGDANEVSARNNQIQRFSTAISSLCRNDGGNVIY